jgi:hypothetical protein
MMLYLTPSIIQSLALKLYSAVPHSMADERTVSVITWMNPALRNLEKVNTIFSFAQIRGWYRDQAKQGVSSLKIFDTGSESELTVAGRSLPY